MNTSDRDATNGELASNTTPTLDFSELRDHLATGYDNSQSTVRFLDTKAAAVVGFVPLAAAITTSTAAKYVEGTAWEIAPLHSNAYLAWVFQFLLFIACCFTIWFAFQSVRSALRCLIPRGPGSASPSLLFPFRASDFIDRLEHFKQHPNHADIIEDYDRQLRRMSEIVSEKLTSMNRSVGMLQNMLVCAVIVFVLLAVAIGATYLL